MFSFENMSLQHLIMNGILSQPYDREKIIDRLDKVLTKKNVNKYHEKKAIVHDIWKFLLPKHNVSPRELRKLIVVLRKYGADFSLLHTLASGKKVSAMDMICITAEKYEDEGSYFPLFMNGIRKQFEAHEMCQSMYYLPTSGPAPDSDSE
jgi:hypothetical protein